MTFMGDMADMINDQWEDDGSGPPSPEDYLDMTDTEMVAAASFVRGEKNKSIRRWFLAGNKLSPKQRWCLAFALCEKDLKYA